MKRRSPAAPLLLPIITFGIYALVWLVKTKNELNRSNTETRVPTAWLLIVPIANYVWYWKYAKAAREFTRGGISAGGAFWLLVLLSSIGAALVQSRFNRSITAASAGAPVFAPAAA